MAKACKVLVFSGLNLLFDFGAVIADLRANAKKFLFAGHVGVVRGKPSYVFESKNDNRHRPWNTFDQSGTAFQVRRKREGGQGSHGERGGRWLG